MFSPLDSDFQKYAKLKLKNFSDSSISAVLILSSEGGTVPFISRYRKEMTGNLDEVQVRLVIDVFEGWKELVHRKGFVLTEIKKQGALTDILKSQIEDSYELREVEELYRPFKRKKKTKAKLAKEAGLEPLAQWIWQQGQGELEDSTAIEVKAKEYINPTVGYATYDEVLRGVQHIIVEKLAGFQELRQRVKDEFLSHGQVISQKTTQFKSDSKYGMYAEFSDSIKNLLSKKASHRYLALRRGWQERELKVTLEVDEAKLLKIFESAAIRKDPPKSDSKSGSKDDSKSDSNGHLKEVKNIQDSSKRYLGHLENGPVISILKQSAQTALSAHVIPSVTNEQHSLLKENSDRFAIEVFAENVRKVLMSGPFGSYVVLGVDPGLKTGCKLALVDNRGQFISSTVMPILGEGARERAKKLFEEVFKQIQIGAIAVGHGTGGREAETFIRDILKEIGKEAPVIMVNESGASVYSASDMARQEFPDLDVTVRGAISIARRLQDPLAELVKLDPKSIGVGQYQHDVAQSRLKKSLHGVVESCVNQVGVDLNTASSSLLQYVSGIGPALAKAIVDYRKEKGLFKERGQLMSVARFSSKVFEQSAGFLRICGGDVPLDRTGIHPERYMAVKEMARDMEVPVSQLIHGESTGNGKMKALRALKEKREKWVQLVGEYTFDDIVAELKKPGRDPRDPYKIFKFREDIHEVKDLKVDMLCTGIVTNVTNFGAFVDIGVHQDGLVHISQLSYDFVDDPRLVVSPGDQVQVKVIGIEVEKNQIFLTMCLTEKPKVKVKSKAKRKPKDQGHGRVNGENTRPHDSTRVKARGEARAGGSSSGRQRSQNFQKGSSKGRSLHPSSRGGGGTAQGKRNRKGSSSRSDRQSRRRTPQPFNNPFAALTELKK